MKFFEKFFYRHVVPFIASKNCSDAENMSSAVFINYFYIFCKNSIFLEKNQLISYVPLGKNSIQIANTF